MSATRWAGILLFVFAILTLAAPFLPSHADYDARSTAQEIATFYRDDVHLQTLQAWLHAGPAVLLFIAVLLLQGRLRALPERGPTIATTMLVAAGAYLTINAMSFLAILTAIRSSNEGFDPYTALFLYNVGWIVMVFSTAFIAPFLVGPLYFANRDAGVPTWLRFASLIIALLCLGFVAASALHEAGQALFGGLILLLLWAILAGVTFAIQRDGAPTSGRPPTATLRAAPRMP